MCIPEFFFVGSLRLVQCVVETQFLLCSGFDIFE